jgi:hypothetical protein
MVRLRERLRKLERSPMLRRLPDPVDPTTGLALRQISDEDLALLIAIAEDQEAGICRPPPSPRELEAITAYETAMAKARDG